MSPHPMGELPQEGTARCGESRPLHFLSLLLFVCGRAWFLSEETHVSPRHPQLLVPSATGGGLSGFKEWLVGYSPGEGQMC